MKRYLFIITLILAFACESHTTNYGNAESSDAKDGPEFATNQKIDIQPYIGKYLGKEKAFEKEPLKSRLSKLMGKQYEGLVKYWNTETPLEQEGEVLHASGCKAHDCSTIYYELYVDLKTNNINVYQFKNDNQRVFKENKEIELPARFAKELKIERENATLQSLPSINKQ